MFPFIDSSKALGSAVYVVLLKKAEVIGYYVQGYYQQNILTNNEVTNESSLVACEFPTRKVNTLRVIGGVHEMHLFRSYAR